MNRRAKINEIKVPSFVVKKTYVCDCGFQTDTEQQADAHFSVDHTVAETVHTGGATFLRFDSREDFAAWAYGWYRKGGTWAGPGWYWLEEWNDFEGDDLSRCRPIADYLKQIEEKKKEIAEIEEFVKSHIDTKQ